MKHRIGLNIGLVAITLTILSGLFLSKAGNVQGDQNVDQSTVPVISGNEILISDRIGDQMNPVVTFNPDDNEFLFVWEDQQVGSAVNLYAQRLTNTANMTGTAILVADNSNDDIRPSVTYNPTVGEYLVVWEYSNSETDHNIYGQRMSADGSLIGNPLGIDVSTLFESNPEVVFNPGVDGYTITWEKTNSSDTDIVAMLFDENLSFLTPPINIAGEDLQEEAPAVDYWDHPNWTGSVITWQEIHPTPSDYQIYGQRVSNDGSLVGSKFDISSWDNNQLTPDIACGEQCLVAYGDHPWGNEVDSYIQGAILDIDSEGNLVLLYPNFNISVGAGNRKNPTITWDQYSASELQDEFLVAWMHESSNGNRDIYRRLVAADSSLLEDEFPVVTLVGDQLAPAFSTVTLGNTFIAWMDDREEDGEFDIYAREFHKYCTNNCQCPQEYYCYHGSCVYFSVPNLAYCCERPGCPPGVICSDADMQKSFCPEDPNFYCENACDCGPAHCCKENRCIKDLEDPLLTTMIGGWTGPPACEIGVDPTYCCKDSTCFLGRLAYENEGDELLFTCEDLESGTTRNYCGGNSCFGTACNCESVEQCVDTTVKGDNTLPPGNTCYLLHGGACISNAHAEALYGFSIGDLERCYTDQYPYSTHDYGWQSDGEFAFQRLIGPADSCGNDVCDPGEFPDTCSEDCYCGDGFCAPSELETCSDDCGSCGDDICQDWESHWWCPIDCHLASGDGDCQLDEFWSAPNDCGCPDASYYPGIYAVCGDSYYSGDSTYNPETNLTCPGECSSLTLASSNPTSSLNDQIIWSTRLGGVHGSKVDYFAPDLGRAITVDDGYVYLTGGTYAKDFPISSTFSTPYTSTYNADWDAYAAMLDTDGNLLASRFLGRDSGFQHDRDTGRGIAVDQEGYIYITGSMEVVILEPDLSEVYSYTNGLYDLEGGYDIAVDSNNNIYLAGSSTSGGIKLYPEGSLAYTATLGGTSYDVAVDSIGNAYFCGSMGVVKLDSSGGEIWSTNLEGTGYGIVLYDDLVYVVGKTFSEWFPGTSGAFDVREDFLGDAFLAIINGSSGEIEYGTYLGNDGFDKAWDVVVDNWGNAYITGETHSPDFPTTNEGTDNTLNGFGDAFIVILSPNGAGVDDLLYASYIGGEDPMTPPYNTLDRAFGIAIDEMGYIYITGETGSSDFPTTNPDPPLGFTDLFVIKLDLRAFLRLNRVYVPLVIR